MKLLSYLDVAGLLVCSVYCTIPLFWLVFHPFVERWRQHGRKAYMAIMPAWGVFIAAAFALGWPIRHLHLYESTVAWGMGALFILAGLSIYRSASQGFDRAKISGLAELELGQHEQRLVITGIRTQVRHPIYLGHLCEVMGWTLATGSLALCGLLVFAVITGAIMIHKEDAELEQRFGDAYRQYRSNVPALLPKFPV
ncbi:MAG TPA: isoprenylcysteine carboxylmethyltransferase family protein [Terriglobales bacterium]